MDCIKYLVKLLFLSAVLYWLLIIYPIFVSGAYNIINAVDSSIYHRYATNQKYKYNEFFDCKKVEKTGIFSQLRKEIEGFSDVSSNKELARIIYENQDDVRRIISLNEEYKNYLISIDSSVEGIIEWSERLTFLNEKILLSCIYLLILFFIIIMVVVFKLRKTFYIYAGIIYLVAVLSIFSDGIFDYLVVKVLSLLTKITLTSDYWSYNDIEGLNLIFNQAFKESALTFIIFDTVIQMFPEFKNNKIRKKEEWIQELYYSIEVQCSYLLQFQNNDVKYFTKLNAPVREVIKQCNDKIKKNRRSLKFSFRNNSKQESLIFQNKQYEKLKNMLLIFDGSKKCAYTNKEHIEKMRQIQSAIFNIFIKNNTKKDVK